MDASERGPLSFEVMVAGQPEDVWERAGYWRANAGLLAVQQAGMLDALQRINAATPANTNSATIAEFQSWCGAVAATAIAAATGEAA